MNSETNFNQNLDLNPGALVDFASVAEQVGATTKRLTKASLLGSYFISLSDNDLVLAARYFSGYIFPLRDQRTINIGGAALLSALAKLAEGIAAVSEQEKSALQERLVKRGDPGDVTEEAFTNNFQPSQHQPILTLDSLSNQLELLAATTGTKRKTEQVIELLKMATPLEAKYIVKLLAGDLRIGLKEGAVEDAIEESNEVFNVVELENDINQTPTLEAGRDTFKAFVERIQPDKSVGVLHDSDADGVTAGVVLHLALSRAGFEKVKLVAPNRQRNAWTPANRERVIAAAPSRLFVLDLGSQSQPVIASVPTCFIDHYRPEGVPPGDTLYFPSNSRVILTILNPILSNSMQQTVK